VGCGPRLTGLKRPADRFYLKRLFMSSAVLTSVLAAQSVHAQSVPGLETPNAASPPAASAEQPAALPQHRFGTIYPQNQGPPAPNFQLEANVNFSESYVTNASGLPGATQIDYLSSVGGGVALHEHSRRLSLDANYSGQVDFYAKGTLPTQINNNLQLVGNLDVIHDHLTLGARAFAQPVVVSSLGILTADNRVVPNGFQNSYGYYVNPEFQFKLANFAISETVPSFGQAFFTNPPGTQNFSLIPGLLGPQDTTSRSVIEKVSSGTDFDRLNWNLVASFSETARAQSLLSEKAGLANLRYALGYEFSLLATGGYDAISNTIPLNRNISGPVALGGFALVFGNDFALQIEAGQKYNSPSLLANLHYNITSRFLLTASVNDSVQTPEGDLLNNLSNLTARPDGTLGSADVLGNGSTSSLSSYSIQSPGNLSLDQNISRYQTAIISFTEEFGRNHASVSAFGTRRTILSGVFFGPARTDSYGTQILLGRDLTPLLSGTIGGTYSRNTELGGEAQIFQLQGGLSYSLSRQTRIYANAQYLERSSSAFLQSLSPFTGSLSDVRATIGISHQL
jgi:uncharacterized protein (PEP-CTERM system associated)